MTMAPWTKTVPIDSLPLSAAVSFIPDQLKAGIVEAMLTTNIFFEALPFQRVAGAIGEIGETYYQNCANDVPEISSAAKKLGRAYMRDVAETLSTHNPMSVANQPIDFDLLGFLHSQVKAANFFMVHNTLILSIYTLYRTSGTAWDMQVEFPSGRIVPVHKGVPIFRNDFMDEKSIVIGRFDDGTKTKGVSGLIPDDGFIGAARYNSGWLLTFTGELAIFDDTAVASLTDVERY